MAQLDEQQVSHIARLAILAMCARGVASAEFENPEIQTVQITVFRPSSGLSPGFAELPVELEIFGASDVPMGGVGL
jgi:hypothetical protein